jgi:uncharacterized damage-inducible protein DinB
MTVAEARELFAYNAWANRQFFTALRGLSAAQYVLDLQSSHGGLHGTLCHIVWAEHLWLNRWLGQPNPAVAQGNDLATLAAAEARWTQVDAERATFLASLSERRLDDTVTVQPTTGGAYVHTLHQMLRHVVDHSSYHRGQLVTLLRQVGVKPPSTGLIVFYRERQRTDT